MKLPEGMKPDDFSVLEFVSTNKVGECNLQNLKHLVLEWVRLDAVATLRDAFKDCISLETVVIRNVWLENVTDFTGMFENCISLKNVEISDIEVEGEVILDSMFSGCRELREVNVSGVFKGVKSISGMFTGCESIREIDLTGIDISGIPDDQLFKDCHNLEKLILRNCNEKTIANFYYALYREIGRSAEQLIVADDDSSIEKIIERELESLKSTENTTAAIDFLLKEFGFKSKAVCDWPDYSLESWAQEKKVNEIVDLNLPTPIVSLDENNTFNLMVDIERGIYLKMKVVGIRGRGKGFCSLDLKIEKIGNFKDFINAVHYKGPETYSLDLPIVGMSIYQPPGTWLTFIVYGDIWQEHYNLLIYTDDQRVDHLVMIQSDGICYFGDKILGNRKDRKICF